MSQRKESKEKKKEDVKTVKVKTLVSNITVIPPPFVSIFPCKRRPATPQYRTGPKEGKNVIRIKSGVFGPLIVIHRDLNDKVVAKPKKKTYEELQPVKQNSFFKKHEKCPETEYYWKDLLHPKILRHYSPNRKKVFIDKKQFKK